MTKLGIDRIGEYEALFRGKRLGLLTGPSAIGASYRSSIDLLRERFTLTRLFAPEHGVRGELQPGRAIRDQRDPGSGLPITSLFQEEMRNSPEPDSGRSCEAAWEPPEEALREIDMLLFDMQDAGSRYYTFASSLYYAMRACAAHDLPLVVLDRPNPLDGLHLEGNCQRPENLSFIGLSRIPIRHGWTLGELARYYVGERGLRCALQVLPLADWRRGQRYEDCGLPFVPPSPNLPTLDALALYNGSCLLAGTNVSEGRGTTQPFELIGAPYIRPPELEAELNALHLPGLHARACWFQPQFSKYAGEICGGVQLHVEERAALEPVALGVWLIRCLQALYPRDFAFRPPTTEEGRWHIDLASGTDELRKNEKSAPQLLAAWRQEAEAFRPMHRRYCLYEA